MDAPVPDPKYKLSIHSYYTPSSYVNPWNWSDVGHAFVSISKDDELLGAVGLWPMASSSPGADVGITFGNAIGYSKKQPGKVRSEIATLRDHEADLRTQSWSITPEQAKSAMNMIRKDMSSVDSYDLYTNNCATYAKSVADRVGLDTSRIHARDCYSKTLRPAAIWSKLELEKRGPMKLPSKEEMDKRVERNDWLTENGFTDLEAMNYDPELERRRAENRLKMEQQIKLAKEKEALSKAPSIESQPLVISTPEHVSSEPKAKSKDDKAKPDLSDM